MRNHPGRPPKAQRRPPLGWQTAPQTPSPIIVDAKGLRLDFDRRVIMVRGKAVHLAPKEFELLHYLVANRDRPVSYPRMLRAVWGPAFADQKDRLRVVVNELRKKIEVDPAKPKYILTEFCIGYRFVLPAGARIMAGRSAEP